MHNAGEDGSVIVSEILERGGHWGFNARTREHVDLVKEGIIDPTKVTRSAIQNAASMAGMLLTAECLVAPYEADSDEKKAKEELKRKKEQQIII
ncbi:MAG: TCP-1/cpn60 chaperonin family protein [Planctomycetota bacterium]|nr:TCP-1/cpn60 chaperonin family protein [Planctomycetota bacterium]